MLIDGARAMENLLREAEALGIDRSELDFDGEQVTVTGPLTEEQVEFLRTRLAARVDPADPPVAIIATGAFNQPT